MELRAYWNLFRRRWLLVVIPTAVVLILGLLTYRRPVPVYNVGVRFIVAQDPSPAAAETDEERYYNWLTSEYIANGLNDWVRGGQFAEAVHRRLAQEGISIPPPAVQASIAADNTRSMMVLYMNHSDPAALEAMMTAAAAVLVEENASGLPQLGGRAATVIPMDEPIVNRIPGGIRSQFELPLRIALALAAGVGLALLAHYFDPTVQGREELEEIGLPVIGEIPKK